MVNIIFVDFIFLSRTSSWENCIQPSSTLDQSHFANRFIRVHSKMWKSIFHFAQGWIAKFVQCKPCLLRYEKCFDTIEINRMYLLAEHYGRPRTRMICYRYFRESVQRHKIFRLVQWALSLRIALFFSCHTLLVTDNASRTAYFSFALAYVVWAAAAWMQVNWWLCNSAELSHLLSIVTFRPYTCVLCVVNGSERTPTGRHTLAGFIRCFQSTELNVEI